MNSTKMFSFQQILLRSPNGHIEHLCDVKEAWCFGALPPTHTHALQHRPVHSVNQGFLGEICESQISVIHLANQAAHQNYLGIFFWGKKKRPVSLTLSQTQLNQHLRALKKKIKASQVISCVARVENHFLGQQLAEMVTLTLPSLFQVYWNFPLDSRFLEGRTALYSFQFSRTSSFQGISVSRMAPHQNGHPILVLALPFISWITQGKGSQIKYRIFSYI